MKEISILIKPVSSNCNLSCKYCFYRNVSTNREIYSKGVMQSETMNNLVKKTFVANNRYVNFSFQGGEPTLAGIDFFYEFIKAVEKHNIYNAKVSYSIQTNGYSIDEKWAKFFKANDFLVGVSLDGPKNINDELRRIGEYKGTYNNVMRALRLLSSYEVPVNILCVVTAFNSRHIEKVYKFFKKEGFTYLQFIPCIEPFDSDIGLTKYSLKNSNYSYSLNRLFELYKEDYFNGEYISIRLFDNYIRMILGEAPENCGISGRCSCYFVIESNGDTYPCDFYSIDKYLLGNINTDSFEKMMNSDIAIGFIKESEDIEEKCLECKHFRMCRGGCKRYRYVENKNGVKLNYFCDAYYDFFEKNMQGLVGIARAVSNNTLLNKH